MIEKTYVKEFDTVGTIGGPLNRPPAAHYNLTVLGVTQRIPTAKSHYREWTFATQDGVYQFTLRFYPWTSRELLLAVGGKAVDENNVEWNDETVTGVDIEAEVYYEPDKANPKKTYVRLRNIKTAIPF